MTGARPFDGGPPDTRLTVLYDADCGLCTRVAREALRLDRGRRLRFVSLQLAHLDASDAVVRLAGERDLAAALHVVDANGDPATGGEAVLRILEAFPMLRPMARLGRLPPIRAELELIYRLVAGNRLRISRGLGLTVCRIPGAATET